MPPWEAIEPRGFSAFKVGTASQQGGINAVHCRKGSVILVISLTRLCRSPRAYRHGEGTGWAVWGQWGGNLGHGERTAEPARGVLGETCYLGGKAVGNPTMTWVEELWEFGPRSGKGCWWGPCTGGMCCGLGRGQHGHDFWRRQRWATFPTSLTGAPCASHCMKDCTAIEKQAAEVGFPALALGRSSSPLGLSVALGNHFEVPQLWLWCSLSSADIPVTPFIKKQSKQTKREEEKRESLGQVLLPVASWSNWEQNICFFCLFSLYLPLHTYSAAKGTALGFTTCCSVLHLLLSPQSVV